MDKNTIIGLLLIAGILFTFTLVTEPEPEEEVSKTEERSLDILKKADDIFKDNICFFMRLRNFQKP